MFTFALQNRSLPESPFAVLCRTARRHLALRGLTVSEGSGDYTVTLTVDPSLADDRYVITPEAHGVSLAAANVSSLFAAFGRFLRASRFDGRGGFTPPQTPIDFTPKSPLRGMYFATHFGNFYHNAPLDEVFEVIEDLALRGCNNLLVWFDMHHFTSMEDPAAVLLVGRLRAILKYANGIGIGGSLTMLANESFSTSHERIRASWTPQNGYHAELVGHFHVEICPSKVSGTAEIVRARRAMLKAFADLQIDRVIYWPYDQGGCTCLMCAPWGSRGFLQLLPSVEAVVREVFPDVDFVVSTWYFDRFIRDEWTEFLRAVRKGRLGDRVTTLLAFFENGEVPEPVERSGIPHGYDLIDFPEISMYGCTPWGAYGASHLASFLNETNRKCGHLFRGGYPYSEGIFEDANKFIQLAYYSGEHENAFDALRDYVRYEFCCADEDLYEAVRRTETGLHRKRNKDGTFIQTNLADPSDVAFVYETLSRYAETLPASVTASRNFRLYYLRAVIDYELVKSDGYAIRSERAQNAMRELCELYHATDETHPWVKPPVGL